MGLYLAREIFIPLAFAITLTLILTPPVGWLRRMRVRHVPSVMLAMVISLSAASGIGWVIFNQLIDVANELSSYQQNIQNKIQAMRAPNKNALGRAADTVKELGKELATVEAPTAPPVHIETQSQNVQPASGSHPLPVQIVEQPTSELAYLRGTLPSPFGRRLEHLELF